MKRAVTISGGYDSYAAFLLIKDKKKYDLVFFDYGQSYLKNELKSARRIARVHKKS